MPWNNNLVGVHLSIAGDTSPVLHVLAGPGTGKTFAMMRRIARLLEEGVPANRILAVTFTRTAARDLREQLAALTVLGAEAVKASTLHSLCFSILASQQAFSFNQRTPRPLLSYEVACLEADLAGDFWGIRQTRRLLEAYEAAWARLQKDEPGHAPTPEDQKFETALLAWLKFHQAMLVGELVPLTLSFASGNPAITALPSFDHVLADEYQDLNKADQALVRALAAHSSLLVVGDDNQSIYSFRYANPEGIRTFSDEVAGTVKYAITECRRCPPNIVAISNSLISHDPHTTRPNPLTSDSSKLNAEVWIVQHPTLADEVANLADFIDHYLSTHGDVLPGRVLILTPRRFIGNAIKDALIAKGRNALSFFQEDALDSDAAAEGFALLTLIAHPMDRAALRAWLGFRSPDHKAAVFRRVRKHCETSGTALDVTLSSLATGTLKIPYTTNFIARWKELQARLAVLQGLTGPAFVDALWPAHLVDVSDIRLLASRVAHASAAMAPEELLEELRDGITQPELPGSDSDVIQVMSLHKSKGLTRDVVIIAGCMAGTLPYVDDSDPAQIQIAREEEQRRLLYVAITRATRVLVISAAVHLPLADAFKGGAKITKKTFMNGVPYTVTTFTPFLSELGTLAPKPISSASWRAQVGLP